MKLCRHAGSDNSRKFAPVERELVFDVDLTDYDDVRTCGKGGHICNKCWPLMAVAIKVGPAPVSANQHIERQGHDGASPCLDLCSIALDQ